jgi:hypothetical protein
MKNNESNQPNNNFPSTFTFNVEPITNIDIVGNVSNVIFCPHNNKLLDINNITATTTLTPNVNVNGNIKINGVTNVDFVFTLGSHLNLLGTLEPCTIDCKKSEDNSRVITIKEGGVIKAGTAFISSNTTNPVLNVLEDIHGPATISLGAEGEVIVAYNYDEKALNGDHNTNYEDQN